MQFSVEKRRTGEEQEKNRRRTGEDQEKNRRRTGEEQEKILQIQFLRFL